MIDTRRLSFISFLSAISSLGVASLWGDGLKEEFEQNAVSEWRKVQQKIEKGLVFNFGSGVFKSTGDNFVSVSTTHVFGRNQYYGFELHKNEVDDAWFVHDVWDFEETAEHRLERILGLICKDNQQRFWVFWNTNYLLDYVEDERFEITKAVAADFEGEPCVEISFRFNEKVEKLHGGGFDFVFPPEGRFWVDPNRQWALLGWEWWVEDDNFLAAGTNSQFVEVDGVFVSQQQRLVRRSIDKTETYFDQTFTVSDFSFGRSVSSKEFFLPHYGLPEIGRVKKIKKNNRFWFIMISVALGLVVIGTLYGYRVRNRS